jgi:hypothetical protein
VLWETSGTVIVVRWEGRPRSHFSKPIASVHHVTPCSEHTLFLHECSFDFVFRFVCDGWQNRAMCLHQVLREAWQIHCRNPLNSSWGFWRTFFKSDRGFWMTFTFQGRSSVSWRWRMFWETKHQQNDRKCWKNSRTHPRRPSLNNPWVRKHCWDQLWSSPDLNRKFEHAPYCREGYSPTLDKWSKAAARKRVSYERRLTRTQLLSLGS